MSVAVWNCQSRELKGRTGVVYLTAFLGISSSHLIFVTLSDMLGGYTWQPYLVYFISHLILFYFFWHIWVGVYLTEVNTASADLTCQNVLEQEYCILHLANMRPHDWNFSSNVSSNVKLLIPDHKTSVAVWNCHSWQLDVSSSVKLLFLSTRC